MKIIDESFRNAVVEVLRAFKIQTDKVVSITDQSKLFESNYAAYIGITGNPKGVISIEMQNDCAVNITRVISSPQDKDINKMIQETIREVTNQICGHALTAISKHDYDSNMTPPSIIMGNKLKIYHSKESNQVFTRFSTDSGELLLKTFLELKE